MAGRLNNTFTRMMILFVLCVGVALFQPAAFSLPSVPQISGEDMFAGEAEHADVRVHCHSDCDSQDGGDIHSPYQSHETSSPVQAFHFVVANAHHAWVPIAGTAMTFGSALKIDRPPRP
jgi:hypothetical protein